MCCKRALFAFSTFRFCVALYAFQERCNKGKWNFSAKTVHTFGGVTTDNATHQH